MLGHIGNGHVVDLAVPCVIEEWLHEFRYYEHAGCRGGRNIRRQGVEFRRRLVFGAKILDGRVGVLFRVEVEIGAAFSYTRAPASRVLPAIQIVGGAAPGLQSTPRDGADSGHVFADALPQVVVHTIDAFVDKADRADLDSDRLEFIHRFLCNSAPLH